MGVLHLSLYLFLILVIGLHVHLSSLGNQTSCSQGLTYGMSSHTTMTPWSSQWSQQEGRYIGSSSTRGVSQMLCSGRPSTSYNYPLILRPYIGCLYGFANNPVEVCGYLELRTTFTDGTASRTESIRYLVVNADSAYDILLGKPALNRLRAVRSTHFVSYGSSPKNHSLVVVPIGDMPFLLKGDTQEL